MAAKPGALVEQAAARLGAALDARALVGLETWVERMQEWNARIDLTAARSTEELVDLAVADALVIARHVPPGASVVDVGTGAGAPGLALAIVREDLRVTLVEPQGKRTSFLRTVLGTVGRTDVRVERVRGEALAGPGAWDVALSRATWGPPNWLELGVKLVAPGGDVWVLLAREPPPTHPRAEIQGDHAYAWPLTGARRRALRYRTVA